MMEVACPYMNTLLLFFRGYSVLNFYCNSASRKGGAIHVEDSDYINSHTKVSRNLRPLFFAGGNRVDVMLSEDQATVAGNEIYGGWIGTIFLDTSCDNDLSTVASNPT